MRYPRSFVRLRLSRQQFWAMRCTMNIMPISLLGLIGFFAGCSSTHLNYRRPQMTADEIPKIFRSIALEQAAILGHALYHEHHADQSVGPDWFFRGMQQHALKLSAAPDDGR